MATDCNGFILVTYGPVRHSSNQDKKKGCAPTKTSPEHTLKMPRRTAAGMPSASTHSSTNADGADEKKIEIKKPPSPFYWGKKQHKSALCLFLVFNPYGVRRNAKRNRQQRRRTRAAATQTADSSSTGAIANDKQQGDRRKQLQRTPQGPTRADKANGLIIAVQTVRDPSSRCFFAMKC